MLNIHTICSLAFLGESDGTDWTDLVIFAIVIIGGFVANLFSEAKKKKKLAEKQQEIEAARQSQPAEKSQEEWHKVESSEQQRQEFLARARERKLERQKRVRMLKRKLEEGVSDFEHPEVAPLPSEVEESRVSPPPTPYQQQTPSEFGRSEPIAPPPVEQAPMRLSHDSSKCDTTHRLLKDTKYVHAQDHGRAVEVDLTGVDELRHAIVLSEVLGKPKALRAESGYWDI